MKRLSQTGQFTRDVKRMAKRGDDEILRLERTGSHSDLFQK